MAMLREEDRKKVHERLAALKGKVRLVVFTQEMECDYCRETRELAEEVAALSDAISLEVKDFVEHEKDAQQLGIDKIPAVAVLRADGTDYGIRFFGIPAGYEFASLLESLELAAGGDSGLEAATRAKLKQVANPVELQVFVTPTCPYCPRSVVQAFKFAVESDKIRASMVEASEFPHLSNRYNVSGVPHTVIGSSPQPMVGAYPEAQAVEFLLTALEKRAS